MSKKPGHPENCRCFDCHLGPDQSQSKAEAIKRVKRKAADMCDKTNIPTAPAPKTAEKLARDIYEMMDGDINMAWLIRVIEDAIAQGRWEVLLALWKLEKCDCDEAFTCRGKHVPNGCTSERLKSAAVQLADMYRLDCRDER